MPSEVKEFVDEYILIAYDIPANKAKQRKEVLKALWAIGAMGYSQSVYLIPAGAEGMALAKEIGAYGYAVIWKAKQDDPVIASKITINYEQYLKERVMLIQNRFAQIQAHLEMNHLDRANRMASKTNTLISQLEKISNNYNPAWLKPAIEQLWLELKQVYNKKEYSHE